MSSPNKNIFDINSSVFDEILKTIVDKKINTISGLESLKKNTGKLLWKNRTTISCDTNVDHYGNLITEMTYKVPIEFEMENPGYIQMSKILSAVESLLQNTYSNFININKCKMVHEKDKYFVVLSANYADHGPSKKEKK